MEGYTATLTYLFAVGTVFLIVLLGLMVLGRLVTGRWLPVSIDTFVRGVALRIVAVLGVFGVVVSLWYSEVVGLAPCPLCWFARAMMFPIAVIALVAVWRRDAGVMPYTLALSLVGMTITGYHHLYQMGMISGTLCSALEGGGDCLKRYVFEFDMVTMPLMGFALFALVAILSWLGRKNA